MFRARQTLPSKVKMSAFVVVTCILLLTACLGSIVELCRLHEHDKELQKQLHSSQSYRWGRSVLLDIVEDNYRYSSAGPERGCARALEKYPGRFRHYNSKYAFTGCVDTWYGVNQ